MESVLPGAEAFEQAGGPTGVLLCHGFTGSPQTLRPWADYLAGEGLSVSLPRLPGHGTTWQEMARTGAIFGGEHSAHYYFRDFWRADTGMLAALHVLAALGGQPETLSELTAEYSRYAASGEINSTVTDQAGRMAAVKAAYAGRDGASVDELDGLTVNLPDGSWFNLRPSNTEPLLRLNIEAADAQAVAALRDEVLAIVRA